MVMFYCLSAVLPGTGAPGLDLRVLRWQTHLQLSTGVKDVWWFSCHRLEAKSQVRLVTVNMYTVL